MSEDGAGGAATASGTLDVEAAKVALWRVIGQLWLANRLLGARADGERVGSNVVMMGRGEPLGNLDNVLTALRLMLDAGYAGKLYPVNPRREEVQGLKAYPSAIEAVILLKGLANERRLLIMCILAEGELSVNQLNERLALSQSALSQHLAVLREQGLVNTRRDGQVIYYRLAESPALEVIRVLHDQFCSPGQRSR